MPRHANTMEGYGLKCKRVTTWGKVSHHHVLGISCLTTSVSDELFHQLKQRHCDGKQNKRRKTGEGQEVRLGKKKIKLDHLDHSQEFIESITCGIGYELINPHHNWMGTVGSKTWGAGGLQNSLKHNPKCPNCRRYMTYDYIRSNLVLNDILSNLKLKCKIQEDKSFIVSKNKMGISHDQLSGAYCKICDLYGGVKCILAHQKYQNPCHKLISVEDKVKQDEGVPKNEKFTELVSSFDEISDIATPLNTLMSLNRKLKKYLSSLNSGDIILFQEQKLEMQIVKSIGKFHKDDFLDNAEKNIIDVNDMKLFLDKGVDLKDLATFDLAKDVKSEIIYCQFHEHETSLKDINDETELSFECQGERKVFSGFKLKLESTEDPNIFHIYSSNDGLDSSEAFNSSNIFFCSDENIKYPIKKTIWSKHESWDTYEYVASIKVKNLKHDEMFDIKFLLCLKNSKEEYYTNRIKEDLKQKIIEIIDSA